MLYDDKQSEKITPEKVYERLESDLEEADLIIWVGISFEQVCNKLQTYPSYLFAEGSSSYRIITRDQVLLMIMLFYSTLLHSPVHMLSHMQ